MALREHLRTVTGGIHEALHEAAPFARIATGAMDRRGYAALLRFLFRYHAALATACDAGAVRLHVPQLAEAQRRRLAALRADLAVFGVTAPSAIAAMPGEGDYAAGILYTVLGSTLGGKAIYRQLNALLPDDEGRRFFKGAREDVAQWRLFCEALETAKLDTGQVEAGAQFAFACFAQMLDEETATT